MIYRAFARAFGPAAIITAAMVFCCCSPPRATGPLPQEAYVWQRAWDGGPQDAVRESSPYIAGVTALAAEVSWDEGQARTVSIAVDWPELKESGVPVGLALRAGPYSGTMGADSEFARILIEMAKRALAEARAAGVEITEVQVDFDCAESKLAGFRESIGPVRELIAPTPLVITVLPSWLGRREFKKLAGAVDGFVLQVHSLEPPKNSNDRFTLCDPAQARTWVESAGRLGVPFRVALPTYGYLTAFNEDGKFIGLSAEGPDRLWPAGTRVTEVRTDPGQMAALVKGLTDSRPASLAGVIWYRLPVGGDRLNWPLETLRAVASGRKPRSELKVEARHPEPGLVDVVLRNTGETDEGASVTVSVQWRDAELVAGDGLGGFRLSATEQGAIFSGPESPYLPRLMPGEERAVGWLRWKGETEVEVNVMPKEN